MNKAGISLSTLVLDDNFNDALMKKLADNGDGSYHYLDTLQRSAKSLGQRIHFKRWQPLRKT